MTVPLDSSALRVFVDSVLAAHDGSCLDEPAERDQVAAMLVEVLVEFLRGQKQDDGR